MNFSYYTVIESDEFGRLVPGENYLISLEHAIIAGGDCYYIVNFSTKSSEPREYMMSPGSMGFYCRRFYPFDMRDYFYGY